MKEYKGEYNNSIIFNVYKTLTGLYIEKELANYYNVGDNNNIKFIKEIECIKVTDDNIKHIIEMAKLQNKFLHPYYISIFDLQLVVNFIVYVNKNNNNELYINSNLCEKYNINPKSKRSINRITYAQIDEDDLNKIEDKTKNESTILKRKYIEIELDDIIKPAKKLFTYYLNIDNNTKYIDRNILELIRKNNIEINPTPAIIDNKNCYSITEKEMKTFEDNTSMRGIERIYTKRLTNNTKKIKNNETETIIVYKDCLTDKLYIEKNKIKSDRLHNKIILLNKECYETSIIELENTHNKKFIIVDLYKYNPSKNYSILICRNNEELFISEHNLSLLNIETGPAKKIRINGEIYINIDNKVIDTIKNMENDYTKIQFEYKQIVPANKK